jgi:uncharacterized membrane protein
MDVSDTIRIDAPPGLVWDIVADVEKWPDWCSNFHRIRLLSPGGLAVGQSAEIEQPGLPQATWRVTDFRPGESFSWSTRVRGIDMRATHVIAPDGDGAANTMSLTLNGLAVTLLWPLVKILMASALRRENTELRKECLARYRDG